MAIKDELLDIIAGAIPNTPENEEFCGSDSFSMMLGKCMKAIRQNLESVMEDDN